MTKHHLQTKALVFAVLAATALALPQSSFAASVSSDSDATTALRAKLDKSQFKNVQVSVDKNGVATLAGTVPLFIDKSDADKAARKVKGLTAVRNQIQVGGASIPDSQLQQKLAKEISYDRVGYWNIFDAVGVQVQNGTVTLTGHSHDYPNRDAYLGLVATTPGVKDVVDQLAVDPLSPLDDQLRLRVAHAVYGFTSLNRYAADPAKPIRISVQNGNVALYGVVDSEADKDTAGIRANGVSDVFSVKNYLQVAGQTPETHS